MGANDASYGVSWHKKQYIIVVIVTNMGFMSNQAIMPHVSFVQDSKF